MPSKQTHALTPLVDLIVEALKEKKVSIPLAPPKTTEAFAFWYLEAMKALEFSLRVDTDSPPVTNRDIQMMCRCAVTGANLAESIDIVISFADMLYPRMGKQKITTVGDKTIFSLESLRPEQNAVSHLVDITGIYAYYQLFQWLIGMSLKLDCINIGVQQRDDALPFLRLFNAPVLVGNENYILEFHTKYLDQPVVRTPDELPRFLETFPCEVFNSQENTLARQVEAIITAAIKQHLPIPTLNDISVTLTIPESTLRKRLKEENTSYRHLKESCVMDMAKYYLQRPSMTISDISTQLGFSDDTSFRRAFKNSFHTSPSEWRKNHDIS